jgi:YVTN family beta-propeller protein
MSSFYRLLKIGSLAALLMACGTRLPAGQSTATTQAIILSPTENRFYLFDLIVNRVLYSIRTGQVPHDVVLGPGGSFFIANQMDSSISIFQRADGQTIFKVGTIGAPGRPDRLVYNPTHSELYVTAENQPRVTVYRVASNNRLPLQQTSVLLPEDTELGGIALHSNGNSLYLADQGPTPQVHVLSRQGATNAQTSATFTVNQSIVLPDGARPLDALFHNNLLYVTDQFQDRIYVIDTAANTLTQTISLRTATSGDRPILPERMAINKAGTKLYVTASGLSAVLVINLADRSLLNTIFLSEGRFRSEGALGIAISNDDRQVYVTSQIGRNFSVINASPDIATLDRLDSNVGTTASEGNLVPLGAIQVIRTVQ